MPSHSKAPSIHSESLRFRITILDQFKPILQGFRRHAGMTQAQLADKLGITQQSYAQIEAHPERTSVERLFLVLAHMGVEFHLDGSKMQQRATATRSPKTIQNTPRAVKRPPGDSTSW